MGSGKMLWNKFFNPRAVAVVGASESKGKVGYSVLKNLIEFQHPRNIYPINPNAETVQGLKSYPSLLDAPDDVDLVVIIIPPKFILSVFEECGKKGIKAVVVISAGFKEIGIEGAKLESEIVKRAGELGIRFIGPNCLGIIDTHSKLNASFSPGVPISGNIAFFSQSGALLTAVLDWAIGEKVGFSKFISIGNKADMSEVDMLEMLKDDPDTDVILGYIEGVTDGVKFMKKAREVSRKKPLIVLKAGSTAAGAKAASSHTGTLAGSQKAFDAAFKQANIIKAESVEDLFDFAVAFSYQPLPQGPNLVIVTNAGGPGIMAADACEKTSLKMATLSKETVDRLREHLPPVAALYNPVDVIGDARADRYEKALEAISEDQGVDGMLVLLTPQEMTEEEETARIIGEISRKTKKPILASFLGETAVAQGIEILNEKRVPNYSYPEHAIRAFETMVKYQKSVEKPSLKPRSFKVDKKKVKDVFARMRKLGIYDIGEMEAREVIAAYGFTLPKSHLAETSEEAVKIAEDIGYPVVMKISSPDILHKSDVGGVRVGLQNKREVKDGFEEIIINAKRYMPQAVINGIFVQEMVKGGKEVILGVTRDPQFGPMIMFGLGGIYVEVLKDVSFRIAPINEHDASAMIHEIHSFPLLQGVRGEKASDLGAIKDSLLRLSQLVIDFPEIIEGDVNPLLIRPQGEGAIAIDVRFTIKEKDK